MADHSILGGDNRKMNHSRNYSGKNLIDVIISAEAKLKEEMKDGRKIADAAGRARRISALLNDISSKLEDAKETLDIADKCGLDPADQRQIIIYENRGNSTKFYFEFFPDEILPLSEKISKHKAFVSSIEKRIKHRFDEIYDSIDISKRAGKTRFLFGSRYQIFDSGYLAVNTKERMHLFGFNILFDDASKMYEIYETAEKEGFILPCDLGMSQAKLFLLGKNIVFISSHKKCNIDTFVKIAMHKYLFEYAKAMDEERKYWELAKN